jgi:hypothetical protein
VLWPSLDCSYKCSIREVSFNAFSAFAIAMATIVLAILFPHISPRSVHPASLCESQFWECASSSIHEWISISLNVGRPPARYSIIELCPMIPAQRKRDYAGSSCNRGLTSMSDCVLMVYELWQSVGETRSDWNFKNAKQSLIILFQYFGLWNALPVGHSQNRLYQMSYQ